MFYQKIFGKFKNAPIYLSVKNVLSLSNISKKNTELDQKHKYQNKKNTLYVHCTYYFALGVNSLKCAIPLSKW